MGASIWENEGVPLVASGVMRSQRFVATAGQTVFNLTNFEYTPNTDSLLVFVNGVAQSRTVDFVETSESVVTLITGVEAGDVVLFVGVSVAGVQGADPVLRSDLASVNGAGLIGITDAAGLYSGNTVEAALQEAGLYPNGITIPGTGKKLKADFSNSTHANRFLFQTSTTNGATVVGAIPNGTGTQGTFNAYTAADPDNASVAQMSIGTALGYMGIISGKFGTGAYLPMQGWVSGLKQWEVPLTGGFQVTQPALLGYGTGAGGTVTQATSKSTTVTINKPCGTITTSNSSLGPGVTASFQVSNALVSTSSVVCITPTGTSIPTNYRVELRQVWSGFFAVWITNITGGTLSEAISINFVVLNSVTS